MVVVSDLIGTLTTGSPVVGLVKWVGSNQSTFRSKLYLTRQLPSYLFAKWGWIDSQAWGQKLMVTALQLIKKPNSEDLTQMAAWSVEVELWPKRRQDVLDRLTGHVREGAQVYIASSIYEPTVQAFAGRIGVGGIGTPLEIVDRKVRFAETIAADGQKADKVLSQLGVGRVDIVYGDTWADIPLLEHADRPVAVYPDQVLKRTALERGWEIIGDRNMKGNLTSFTR